MIRSLCNEYADLTEAEIEKLERIAGTLQLLANIENADTFVDCLTTNGEAIVVAQAKPVASLSAYNTSFVGMLIKKENEPAVIRSIRLGISSRQMKAGRQENIQVVQLVEPIHFGHRVIGVLVVERQVDGNNWLTDYIDKRWAIKEMHHRIKNNLQNIASLLRIQGRHAGSQETQQVLSESLNRILAIASAHELLASSGVDNVKIGGVISNIKNNTIRYFAENRFVISILLEGDDFEIDSDLATTIALIINELLQNALKYAFVGRSEGVVRITVEKGEVYSKIQLTDNGIGFDLTKADKSRLGLSIVKSFVQDKLKGDLDIESGEDGTKVIFSFLNNDFL